MAKQPTRPTRPNQPKPQSSPPPDRGGNRGITRPPKRPNPPKK